MGKDVGRICGEEEQMVQVDNVETRGESMGDPREGSYRVVLNYEDDIVGKSQLFMVAYIAFIGECRLIYNVDPMMKFPNL